MRWGCGVGSKRWGCVVGGGVWGVVGVSSS